MRAQLLHRLLPRGHRGSDLVDLVYGDKLLGQQRLNAMKVVGLVSQFGVGAVEGRLRSRNICFGFAYRGCGAIDVRASAIRIGPGCPYRAHLRSNRPSLIDDLALQRTQIRSRLFQGVFVGPWIDLEEQLALFAELVVLNSKLGDGAVNLRSDADKVGKYFRIICARVVVGVDDHHGTRNHRGGDDGNADNPAETAALRICFVFGHRISFRIS